MGITYVNTNTIGTGGQVPVIIYINTTDSNAQIATPGYLNQLRTQGYNFFNGQMALVNSSDGPSFWDVSVTRIGANFTYSLIFNTDGCVTDVTATLQVVSSGGFTPNISLEDQGIGSGTATNANVTYNEYGIITAISIGTSANLPFSVITSSQTLSANNGYIINSVSRLNLLLPSTFNVGDLIWIISENNSPWRITQNAGQQVTYGSYASSVGVGGYVDSLGPDGVSNSRSATFVGYTANTAMTVGVSPSDFLNFQ